MKIWKMENSLCNDSITQSSQTIQNLINIVGKQHVLTDDKDTRLYRQGRRYGAGKVLAVVAPGLIA